MPNPGPSLPRRGRGAAINPANRFVRRHTELDAGALDEDERRRVATTYVEDTSRSILAKNQSPDVPFSLSLNPYRGCEHGCNYCFARPYHEFLGFSAGVDFESIIVTKPDAPRLLAREFERPSWTPQVVAMSGSTDPYQPAERTLRITRGCLEVFARYRNPVALITKNHLVTRDLDLLSDLARDHLVRVMLSVTSLSDELIGEMEPRTSRPARRLDAIRRLSEAGVPVGVSVAPVIPGLTDDEMPAILKACAEAGATTATYLLLRLPGAVEPIFFEWLDRLHPARSEKVRRRLRSLHGGKLSDSRFGHRMRGEGVWADLFRSLFRSTTRRLGLNGALEPLRTDRFQKAQGELF